MEQKEKSPTQIALCVTGSIAAFKAVEIARLLIQQGLRVLPVLTRSGARLVGPATFTALCREVAREDLWDPSFAGELHIDLATRADLVLVAPATADAIARFASGRADDLMTALVLCARTPVVIAPAMHPRMWAHPSTQRNVRQLQEDGRVTILGPVVGQVANGEVGLGRMADPAEIVAGVIGMLHARDLAGYRIVVTAGPTVEDVDPVRFVSNRSSGRMGYAIAQRAAWRGAQVVLISGPVDQQTPLGVKRIDVRSALQMRSALWEVLGNDLTGADGLVMAAAVADYRVEQPAQGKMKRVAGPISIEMVPNPDVIAEIGEARKSSKPVLVGFALETAHSAEELARFGEDKLARKRVDLVVANNAADALGGDRTRALLVSKQGTEPLEPMTKQELADRILDQVGMRLRASS